jgi:hypothetical protein
MKRSPIEFFTRAGLFWILGLAFGALPVFTNWIVVWRLRLGFPQISSVWRRLDLSSWERWMRLRLWRVGLLRSSESLKVWNPLKQVPPVTARLASTAGFPETVSRSRIKAEGWNWIRAGVALGNGFRHRPRHNGLRVGISRSMTDDGAFGESKTVEISHFLGLYARSVLLLLRTAKQDSPRRPLGPFDPPS